VQWNSLGGAVSVIATNSCGSSAPAVLTVTSNCRMAGSNSMLESLHAMVYPNPSQGQLTLQYNSPEESAYLMKVTDLTGRLLQHETLAASEGLNRHAINLSNVAKGVYMLSLENTGGEKIVIRLVIE
jgi:endoglucanase